MGEYIINIYLTDSTHNKNERAARIRVVTRYSPQLAQAHPSSPCGLIQMTQITMQKPIVTGVTSTSGRKKRTIYKYAQRLTENHVGHP